jgi:hypothetical protein
VNELCKVLVLGQQHPAFTHGKLDHRLERQRNDLGHRTTSNPASRNARTSAKSQLSSARKRTMPRLYDRSGSVRMKVSSCARTSAASYPRQREDLPV